MKKSRCRKCGKYTFTYEHHILPQSQFGKETGDWMWVSPADSRQPRDAGYALGHRIVEAYYERAADKEEALRAVFSVTDYEKLLQEGGYRERFEEPATR